MSLRLDAAAETWPIAGSFTISRGSRTEAHVVVATLTDGQGRIGRGECVPYARYGESVAGVLAEITGLTEAIAAGLTRQDLQTRLPPGAARNALDCAFWDLAARQTGRRAWELAGVVMPESVTTAYTLSLGDPDSMAAAARAAAGRPLLKVKLGGDGDAARIAAVRAAAPDCVLIVDANEAWRAESLAENLAACRAARVALIEQPLPAGADAALRAVGPADLAGMVICADESAHASAGLAALTDRYGAINIKLDKTGGLTEALAVRAAARDLGLRVMVGCMLATSLAMAPGLVLAADADYVDLDGPLLLAQDRVPGLVFTGSQIAPPPLGVWG